MLMVHRREPQGPRRVAPEGAQAEDHPLEGRDEQSEVRSLPLVLVVKPDADRDGVEPLQPQAVPDDLTAQRHRPVHYR